MFENLIQIVTGERRIVTPSEQVKTDTNEQKTVKAKFAHDIQALKDAGYTLEDGENIVLELKDALDLMPRDRKRVDAYKSLKDYLNNEFGCILTLKSRKTK